MVSVVLACTPNGELLSISATGHANAGTKGNDLVCAAISFLLRSVALSVGKMGDLKAEKPGEFFLKIKTQTKELMENSPYELDELKSYKKFLASFVKTSIQSLETEYPDSVKLQVKVAESLN